MFLFIFVGFKKKVYMLFNLEPDRSISGGAWYQDQDFESEFVDILNRQCLRFLQQRADKIKNNPRVQLLAGPNPMLLVLRSTNI